MSAEERAREFEEALRKLENLRLPRLDKMWIEYDKQNDILYITFSDEEPDESIMLEDDIIVTLRGDTVLGISIYNFSRRVNL